ncbi:hypothetical protein BaRGS_00011881, partial [Batillaria attramentaria]
MESETGGDSGLQTSSLKSHLEPQHPSTGPPQTANGAQPPEPKQHDNGHISQDKEPMESSPQKGGTDIGIGEQAGFEPGYGNAHEHPKASLQLSEFSFGVETWKYVDTLTKEKLASDTKTTMSLTDEAENGLEVRNPSSPAKRQCSESANVVPEGAAAFVSLSETGETKQRRCKQRRKRGKRTTNTSTPEDSQCFALPRKEASPSRVLQTQDLQPQAQGTKEKHSKPSRLDLESHPPDVIARAKDNGKGSLADAIRPRQRSKSADETATSTSGRRGDLMPTTQEAGTEWSTSKRSQHETFGAGSPTKTASSPSKSARRRGVKHTQTWEALKRIAPIGKLARNSDSDRWDSYTVDVIYSVLEFSGDVTISAADSVLGEGIVDTLDAGLSKFTRAAHSIGLSAMQTSAYETLARNISYFWRSTWPGRGLICMSGWASCKAHRLLDLATEFVIIPRFLSFLCMCNLFVWAKLFLLWNTIFLFFRDFLAEELTSRQSSHLVQGSARTLPYPAHTKKRGDSSMSETRKDGGNGRSDGRELPENGNVLCGEDNLDVSDLAGDAPEAAEQQDYTRVDDEEFQSVDEDLLRAFYHHADRVLGQQVDEVDGDSGESSDARNMRERRLTPVKRRVAAMRGGRYPFRLTAPPPTPQTKSYDELTLRERFVCLLRKVPGLSDVLRDPRDPPPLAFLFGTPTYITDDKIRKLLESSPGKANVLKHKRKLDDLYPPELGTYAELDHLDDYISEEDPDYVPGEDSLSTDTLEYTESEEEEEEEDKENGCPQE